MDVGVFGLGRQHDDGPCRVRVDHREVVEIERIAAAADDARVCGVRKLRADIVFHLDLVALGEDHDARILLVRVGDQQLTDDGVDLARPAEDEREVPFDDARAALAQLGQTRLQARGDGADQDADDENAADRHDHHEQAQLPAGIAGDHAGIESAQHRLPHALEEAVGMLVVGRVLPHVHGREDERGQHDDGGGQQRQPADDGDGALGERVLEPVAQLVAPGDLSVSHGFAY